MKPLFVTTLLTLTCLFSVKAQNIDSLKTAINAMAPDTNKVMALLQLSKEYLNIEPKDAIPFAAQARDLSSSLSFSKGAALAYKYIGIAYYQQSQYIEALENWRQSLSYYESLKDLTGIANIQSNIGAIYQNQGNESKALEYLFNSLRNAEQAGDEFRIASALINIGSVYQHKAATYDKAVQYYQRALPMSEKLEDNDQIGTIAGNIGEIFLERGRTDSALYYLKRAEKAFENTVDIASVLINIGRVYENIKNYSIALQYYQEANNAAVKLDSKLYETRAQKSLGAVYFATNNQKQALVAYHQAEKLANSISSSFELKDIYKGLANTYARQKSFEQAYKYQNLLLDIKDTIYNKELDIKLSNYEFNFEIEKKQSQIDLLEKDRVLKELDIRRQKFAKYAFMAGIGLVLIITVIIYRNYRNKVKVNILLDSQKAQIETLLLNILPGEVAKELQQEGHATPRFYEKVSVLFTDFKGFTTIADSLSPQQVVAELNDFFFAFDEITERHGIEKIKTIGDSYMCAGGIPVSSEDHPIRIVRAALEIQKCMIEKNRQRVAKGLDAWEMRIGVHVGPIVAGVVGKNKYAYDIWGTTVNIASRMESNGAPGQVNISESTYELVKHEFICTYRGKISAKNIGEIDMYFVSGTRDGSSLS
ncbi:MULTISPECIES: adenylate/guanylate cyclase domain-containing protein [unclassified Paraflavitalea]|uniref:adenylate/guanylate cyclase domain-containing protein n=1 Tax=unclassified Paraflavitalea TaxID=2798305 RepID=UPI003D33C2BB